MKGEPEGGDDDGKRRRSAALLGLVLILGLAIVGIVLVCALVKKSQLEDCLLSGRKNCAPITAPARE
jgi:hypothetical protein